MTDQRHQDGGDTVDDEVEQLIRSAFDVGFGSAMKRVNEEAEGDSNDLARSITARLAAAERAPVTRGDSVTISRDIAYRAARACDYEGSRLFKNPKYRVASKEWHECAEHLRAALATPTETHEEES